MKKNSVLAIDMGTTEIKAVLVNNSGIVDKTQLSCEVVYGDRGSAEQDPYKIKDNVIIAIKKILTQNEKEVTNIAAITFTSQMQGILPVDKTGTPLMNLITWLDTRAAEITKKVILKGWPKISGIPLVKLLKFLKITGGAPGTDGKNTLAKAFWIKEKAPDIYHQTHKFLDTKDYALFLATGEFVTSIDMAYVTWLMDTHENVMDWSSDICKMFDLDISKLPEIRKSTEVIAKITESFAKETGLPEDVVVVNGSGDLLTSAIGSGAISDGTLHANIGTAGWVGCHFPERTLDIPHYSGTIASGIPDKYLIMCKQETLGGAIDWLRKIVFDQDNFESESQQYQIMDTLVDQSPAGSKDLIFTPWLHGERSPINDAYLRGQLFNIGMYHSRADVVRAVFESVAYNLRWGIEVVEEQSKIPQKSIKIIGGGSKSDIWCQIFADVWQKKVIRMKQPQMASALGAACIAFVSLGIFSDFIEIDNIAKVFF